MIVSCRTVRLHVNEGVRCLCSGRSIPLETLSDCFLIVFAVKQPIFRKMTATVFPKVVTFVRNQEDDSYKVQLNPDGTFTTEMQALTSDVHSSMNWDLQRQDTGTYSLGVDGYTVTFQFLSSKTRKCYCNSTCDCAPGLQSWTPPDSTIECDLLDGTLKNFPGLSGYGGSLWSYGLDLSQA